MLVSWIRPQCLSVYIQMKLYFANDEQPSASDDCCVCYESGTAEEPLVRIGCEHAACPGCWREYLSVAIHERRLTYGNLCSVYM